MHTHTHTRTHARTHSRTPTRTHAHTHTHTTSKPDSVQTLAQAERTLVPHIQAVRVIGFKFVSVSRNCSWSLVPSFWSALSHATPSIAFRHLPPTGHEGFSPGHWPQQMHRLHWSLLEEGCRKPLLAVWLCIWDQPVRSHRHWNCSCGF